MSNHSINNVIIAGAVSINIGICLYMLHKIDNIIDLMAKPPEFEDVIVKESNNDTTISESTITEKNVYGVSHDDLRPNAE